MKKIAMLSAAVLGLSLAARADVITFVPSDADLADLNHDYAYKWGVNSSTLAGKTITGATLTIDNIRDWTIESDDRLYIRLYSSAPSGVTTYYDNEATGDYFAGSGISLITYIDLLPYTQAQLDNKTTIDLTYNFTAAQLTTLMSYAADGNFGLTFDPDCHYYNDGVKLTVTYNPAVPEPSTMALLGVGLLGVVLVGRRRKA